MNRVVVATAAHANHQAVVVGAPVFPVHQITGEQLEAQPTCPVCGGHFSLKAEVKPLPCGHLFHPTCLDTWLATNGSCPVDGTIVVAQAVAAQPAYVGAQQPQPSVYVQAAPANYYHPQAVNVTSTREEICRGCGMRFTPPPDARPNTALYYRCQRCNSAGATCWAICTIS